MKTFLKLLFIIIVFSGIMVLFVIWRVNNDMKPVNLENKIVKIKINRGESINKIVRKLKGKGLIRSELTFKYFLKLKKLGRLIKAGDYTFTGLVDSDMIISTLSKGTIQNFKITIPEGLKSSQIISLLKKSKLKDSKYSYDIINNIDPRTYGISMDTVEGILYPETYFYTSNMSVKELTEKMFSSFKKIIPEDYEVKLKKIGLTSLKELMIISSIVEREAKLDSERGKIASIFLNRLRKKIPFESCATVIYALGHWKPRLLYKDLKINSPYNTYKNIGLPPTPICSPGKKSILSVLNSPITDYYYFVTTGNSDGSHIFSKTFKEHKRAVKKFKAKRRK